MDEPIVDQEHVENLSVGDIVEVWSGTYMTILKVRKDFSTRHVWFTFENGERRYCFGKVVLAERKA